MNKLKVVSLFCGCGGSDLGMIGGFNYLGTRYESLPFEIVYAADFDKWAVDTYNKNFKHKAVCADVTKIDFKTLPDADIMIGGFPCQSFSTVNPTKNINDDRANLYKQVVRFLKIKHPKYFICENVKGLVTLQKGAIINKIVSEFSECGYRVQFKLLKAVEFGIPQKRERVIIVGVRNDVVSNYKYPTPICSESNAIPLSSVIDKLAIDEKKYYFSARAVNGVKMAKNNMKRGLWQDLSQPCLTITAHLAKTSMNSRDPILLVNSDKELYRRFTPREAARIQSFPDEFLLNDSESKSYKQIGNAIPPVFMWYVAKQLEKSIIEGSNFAEKERGVYVDKSSSGFIAPSVLKQRYVQLSFIDMLNMLENETQKIKLANEDAAAYGYYYETMYQTWFHKKFYIARGNAFDYKAFRADGIAAFVKGGFNNLSASYDKMKSQPHDDVHIAEYIYNNAGVEDPTPQNINGVVESVFNDLVRQGAKTIVMPPINVKGVNLAKKDSLTTNAIVLWLNSNEEKINRVIVVDYPEYYR